MSDQTIYVVDALSKSLLQFDGKLNPLKTGNMPEAVVHIEEKEATLWVLAIGSFSASDQATGMLLHLPKSETQRDANHCR